MYYKNPISAVLLDHIDGIIKPTNQKEVDSHGCTGNSGHDFLRSFGGYFQTGQ